MNSAMIDLGLGMALLYAVLSLFVTTLQEFLVNSLLRSRGRNLGKLVRSAFGEDRALTEAFFEQPLIMSLSEGPGVRRPSYIPSDLFAKAFLAVLAHGEHPARSGLSPQGFLAALRAGDKVGTAPGTSASRSDIGRSLALATSGTQDWNVFEKEVAGWIASIGDRSEGWYKRSAQRWTFFISFFLAVLLNVDSVNIAHTLWNDAQMRTQLADAAVAVNAARQSGASAPAAAAPAAGASRTADFEAQYGQVEKSLAALEAALKEKDFVQEDRLFSVKCELRSKTCALDLRLGQRCQLDRRFTQAEVEGCQAAAAGAGKGTDTRSRAKTPPKEITPATEWLDDLHELREQLRQGRVEASKRGARLERTDALALRIDTVDQTLAHIIGEMQWLGYKLPDPNDRAARTVAGITRSALELQREIALLYRAPAADLGRVRDECSVAFARDSGDFQACVHRHEALSSFKLPMGFAPEVMARQLSSAGLEACRDRSCGVWSLLGYAAMNGALLGWLLTATALSLGAPFWFDTLGRLVKLRASGATSKAADAPQDGARKDADTKAPPAPAPGPAPGGPGGGRGTSDLAAPIEASLSKEELKELQRRLSVPATGVWDERTRAAITQRRAALHMPAGAELDATLYEAILERRSVLVQEHPLLKLDAQGEPVAALRARLSQLLPLPERARGQGDRFDRCLRDAVRLFQGRAGLAPDGVVGEQTWRVLDSGGSAPCAADAWMGRAIASLGLDEQNNKDEIRQMLDAVQQGDQDPAHYAWCACFVAWVLEPAHRALLPALPMRAASWDHWGVKSDENRYGAVLLLRERGKPDNHHLAFLVGATLEGWVVLGGNQGTPGQVSVTLFPSDQWELVHQGLPPVQG